MCPRSVHCAHLTTTPGKTAPTIGRVFAVCADPEHGSDGNVLGANTAWRSKPAGGDGLGAELGIWDKLLECVPADGHVHPYGDVEDRFFERYPEEAHQLLERYGHKWRDADRSVGALLDVCLRGITTP